jgi:biofilm PGA synthesis N-glycosyltransferase PgaC
MIHCCVGIMAYNEEANIGRLLEALLAQKTRLASLDEILVVASGCTDRTEAIVEEFAARDGRIRLLTQVRKEGKAAAVNLLSLPEMPSWQGWSLVHRSFLLVDGRRR